MVRNEHRHRRSKTRGIAASWRESRSRNDCQGQFPGVNSRSPMPSCRTDHQRVSLQRHVDRSQRLEDPADSCTEPSVRLQRSVCRHTGRPGRRTLHCEAARRKTQVIVSDVASDTRWNTYGWRTAALAHGLKACWSTTILASDGLVLGTFAIYWHEPCSQLNAIKRLSSRLRISRRLRLSVSATRQRSKRVSNAFVGSSTPFLG
jgi:GAF domain-containing protein